MIEVEEIEHTADVRVRLCVDHLEELYTGVVEVIRRLTHVETGSEVEDTVYVNLEGEIEDQLFDLGNELIFQLSRDLFPVSLTKGEDKLVLELGRVIHPPRIELKALTYHELKVIPIEDRLCTHLVFDV